MPRFKQQTALKNKPIVITAIRRNVADELILRGHVLT